MEKTNKPLISVIIPIYKAEKYIEKCVKAVQNQTYQNLEIILVDDGSPDESGVICDRLATEDSRIRVLHKENGGAATARNAGLDVMTGAYIAFVDADDYMELNYIETLYHTLSETNAQVAICSFKTIDEAGNPVSIDSLHDESSDENIFVADTDTIEVFTGNEIILQDLQGHWEHVAPWGKLYQADLFEGVRYPKWPAYEDEPVFIRVFDKVETAAASKDRLYYYVQHAGSLMNTAYSEKQRSTTIKMWHERIEYYSDNVPRHNAIRNCVLQAFVAWNVLFLSLHAHEMTKEQKLELKREIRRYFTCLFKSPHLYNSKESIKLAVKCVLTLISTDILRKRYTN
ncbi:MAG: glycosyltransferase family 2 protein [Roseburia sp.]|nr:glycosyltransferase family 2 protein [Roseburia sp.]